MIRLAFLLYAFVLVLTGVVGFVLFVDSPWSIGNDEGMSAERDLLLPPNGETWFGAFVTQEETETTDAFTAVGERVGKHPAIHMIYRPWNEDSSSNFPTRFATLSDQMGAIPMVTWEPWWNYSPDNYPLLRDIADGRYDDYLGRFLKDAARFDKPWFLRFAHEVELAHYPWSEAYDSQQTSRDYVNAFRHISSLARRLAPKTLMIWSPNSGSIRAMDWYPGDLYVDWVGASLYNFPRTPQNPDHQDKLNGFMAMVELLDKPSMIAEMGCAQNYVVTSDWDADGDGDYGDRKSWINPDMADKVTCINRVFSVIENEYPDIKGLVWFDIDKDADWRLDSSEAALQAFTRRIDATRYVGAPIRVDR